MILEETTEIEVEEMPEILRGINQNNPHRMALSRLKIGKKRVDSIFENYDSNITTGDYIIRFLEDIKGYVCLGQDNKFYLTRKGAEKAGLENSQINNPADARGQIQLFLQASFS